MENGWEGESGRISLCLDICFNCINIDNLMLWNLLQMELKSQVNDCTYWPK